MRAYKKIRKSGVEVQVVLEQAHIWASPIAINLLVGDAQHVYVFTPVESQ